MDVSSLIIQMEARGDAPQVINRQLQQLGYTAQEIATGWARSAAQIAASTKSVSAGFEQAQIAARGLVTTMNASIQPNLLAQDALLQRMQAEKAMLADLQTAWGKYSNAAQGYSRVMLPQAVPADMLAARNVNTFGNFAPFQQITESNAAMNANKQVVRELIQYYQGVTPAIRNFATSVGISSQQMKELSASTLLSHASLTQFLRGMAAGFFQFTLLAGGFVIFGRTISAFTTDAVKAFNELESEAANLSQVQPQLDLSQVEAQLQRIQRTIPATLKEIATAGYEVASLGNQNADVTEKLTASITTNAKAMRADIKEWTDDTITSMNQWQLWGKTADETFQNANMVQAKFAQGAKDSQATPKEFAASWGVVALAVQQAGGSIDDAVALMVGASRGVGSFEQNMTNLARVLQELNQPDTRNTLEGWGIALVDAAGNAKPILEIFKQLNAYFDQMGATQQTRQQLIEQAFPQARGTRGVQVLLDQLKTVEAEYPKLSDAQKAFSEDVDKYLNTNSATLQKYQNQWDTFQQDLGRHISPPQLLQNLDQSAIGQAVRQFIEFRQNMDTNFGGGSTIGVIAKLLTQDQGIKANIGKPFQEVNSLVDSLNTAISTVIQTTEQYVRTGSEGNQAVRQEFAATIGSVQSLDSVIQQAAATFSATLKGSILDAMSVVRSAFTGLPSELLTILQQANRVLIENDPTKSLLASQASMIGGNIEELNNLIRDARANPNLYPTNAVETYTAALNEQINALQKLYQSNLDAFDPAGAEARAKAIEQNRKQIEELNQQIAKQDALNAVEKKVADAQKELADTTAHYNAQLQIQRDLVTQLGDSLSSLRDLLGSLKDEAQSATEKGLLFSSFTGTTGPAEIDKWAKSQTDAIERSRQSRIQIVQNSNLSATEIASQIASINAASETASGAIGEAVKKLKEMLASMPEGLTQTQSEFENTIHWYEGKIRELQALLAKGQEELTRRQNVVFNSTPSTGATAGLRGPFSVSDQDLASANPSFLNWVPGRLAAATGGAQATTQAIEELRRLIEDPIIGGGFLGPFMQALADAKAQLRADQAAAEDFRRTIAAQQFELDNAQFDLSQREKAALRPLTDELWQYNLALSDEQHRQDLIQRQFDRELIPLQRELNKLKREQNELAREEERLNTEQTLNNMAATLTRLTPGTAQYLAVRQGLVKAEADYALKQQEYSLQDRIDSINEQKEAQQQASTAQLEALQDIIYEKQREQNITQHGFDLEQRIIDDRKALLDDELRRYNYNESQKEIADQKLIDLATLELEAVTRASGAWVGYQSASNQAISDQITGWQNGLNEWSNNYQTWKDEKLKPLQDQVNEILKSAGKAVEDGLDGAIAKIKDPGGIIDQIQAIATKEEATKEQAVAYWKDQDKALQDYYTHLSQMARMADLISQGKYQEAANLGPLTSTPTIPQSNEAPGGSGHDSRPPSGNVTTKTVGIWPIGEPGQFGQGSAPPPGSAWGGVPSDAFSIVPMASSPASYAQVGAVINFSGQIIFQGGGPYNSQADADRDARLLMRALTGYQGMTGTNQGFGWGSNS